MVDLAEAWARAMASPLPPWEKRARVGFAGAHLSYHLSVRFTKAVDWSSVERALHESYTPSDDGVVMRGRRIRLEPRRLVLEVWGTTRDLPVDDGGRQSALLLLVLDTLRGRVASVTTERWTDTPFEEPPPHRRTGQQAVAFLEQLVCHTCCVRVERLDYFTESANPEILLVLDATSEKLGAVRRRWLPVEIFLRPGRYELRAEAPCFSFPGYHPDLSAYARRPLWTSARVTIEGRAGETTRIHLAVPEQQRGLTEAERRFFLQRRPWPANPAGARVVPRGQPMDPPPTARDNIEITLVGRG